MNQESQSKSQTKSKHVKQLGPKNQSSVITWRIAS